jgi:hypothetical protein
VSELRPAPREPINLLIAGVVLGIVGGIIAVASEEAAPLGVLVAAIGGLIATIGAVGYGVLLGMRSANYEEYLYGLIEAGDDEDDEA